jgi:acyl-CoA synthetase (AMP-forming)/AMP-acid ligase II
MKLGHHLTLNTRRHPDKWALTFEDRTYTYSELNRQVNRLANGLMDLGIKKGEKVALMLKNTDYFAISYYALAKIGAVIVPMNFRLVADEVSYILGQSDSVAVITDESSAQTVEDARKRASAVRHVIAVPTSTAGGHLSFCDVLSTVDEEPAVEILPEDDLQIMYTSGTTGRPKGALFDHQRVVQITIAVVGTLGHRPDDRFLHVAPLFHAAQLTMCFNAGIFVGASHVILSDFDPVQVMESIEKHKITFFFGVPTMYNVMSQVPNVGDYDLSSVRRCGYGAAPMAASLVRQSMDLFKTDQFFSLAGLTEGGPSGIYLSPQDHQTKLGTSGKEPLLFTEVKVVDFDGNEVGPGVHGEVLLRGETVMKEYYKKPKETAETIVDGWLHTGDLAVKDDQGYITFVDRIKDMIISGGENIYSVEVENALYQFPKVLEAAVVGTPDPKWGEKVNALVVLKPGETTDSQEIQDFCRQHLAGYKIPRNVVIVDSLPRNPSGKLLKYKIREAAVNGMSR